MENELTILNLIDNCLKQAHEEKVNYIILKDDYVTIPIDTALFLIQKAQNPIKTLAKASIHCYEQYREMFNFLKNQKSNKASKFKDIIDKAIRTMTIMGELLDFYCDKIPTILTNEKKAIEKAVSLDSSTPKSKEEKRIQNHDNKNVERQFYYSFLGTTNYLGGKDND